MPFQKRHKGYWLGRKFSEEHRKKMSIAKQGYLPASPFKVGHKPFPASKEVRMMAGRKISAALKGIVRSEETKRKISIANTGKKRTEEVKRKISLMNKGRKPWITGRHHTEETRAKLSRAGMGRTAWNKGKHPAYMQKEKHPMWKGGGTDQERYILRLEMRAGRKRPEQCELCGALGIICYDHDHKTGKFRGWICNRCNWTLGSAKDDIDLLKKMIKYILQSRVG